MQGELETEKGQAVFLGTSLAATVCKCIHLGDRRSANKLRDKFHISERRFAWLVVRSPYTMRLESATSVLTKGTSKVLQNLMVPWAAYLRRQGKGSTAKLAVGQMQI